MHKMTRITSTSNLLDENDNSEKPIEKKPFNVFLINILLFVSGFALVFSGLVLQIGFHMGGPDGRQFDKQGIQSQSLQYEQLRAIDTTKIVSGFNYTDWSAIHKIVVVFFSLLMIYHIYVHLKWYKVVITRFLIGKNIQVIILSVLFLLVAVTGLIPWFIDLSGDAGVLRMLFIEIHDKIALILIVFLILHIAKRAKWFVTTYAKLKR